MKTKIELIQKGINLTRDIMQNNITRMIGNLDSVEVLKDKAEHLKEQAKVFKKRSTKLKDTMWYQSNKLQAYMLTGLIVATVVSIVLLLGQLNVITWLTAALISVALACATAAVIIGTELYFKNPHGFFNKNREDEGHQYPKAKLELN